MKENDVVLVIDDCLSRNNWCLGRVLETFRDKKGLVRSVKIKTKSNILERPIAKLCLLNEYAEN